LSSGNLCSTGSFNENSSSTFVNIKPGGFKISYGDNTQVTGDYINETFSVAGVTVTDMGMALAREQEGAPGGSAALFTGLLGVSFPADEAIDPQGNGTGDTPTFVSQLVLQNKIHTRAFSLWLNDLSEYPQHCKHRCAC
jgi:hypothetical protein